MYAVKMPASGWIDLVIKPCLFEDCGRAARAQDLCEPHFMKWRAGTMAHPDGRDWLWPPCAIAGCPRPGAFPNDWCRRHYERDQKHGDPLWEPTRAPSVCTVDSCERPRSYRSGLCWVHHQRMEKHGSFELPPWPTAMERIRARLVVSQELSYEGTPCVLWTGSLVAGFGHINANGRTPVVHRLVWEESYGSISPGLWLANLCLRKSCCNVKHWELRTPKAIMELRAAPGTGGRYGTRPVSPC